MKTYADTFDQFIQELYAHSETKVSYERDQQPPTDDDNWTDWMATMLHSNLEGAGRLQTQQECESQLWAGWEKGWDEPIWLSQSDEVYSRATHYRMAA